jgi:RHS repeat-associated protein
MRRTHRPSARSRRWTSLFLCSALMLSLLVIRPQAKSPNGSGQQTRGSKPQEPPRQRGRQPAPLDSGKKVDSLPAPRAVSLADVPSLEQVRRRKSQPKAPDPIPSTVKAPRKAEKDKPPKDKKAEIRVEGLKESVQLLGSSRMKPLARNFLMGIGSKARSGNSVIAFATGFRWLRSSDSFSDENTSDSNFDLFAPPVPQGGSSKIVFASNREGSMQIYVMNGDGSGVSRLTYTGANDDFPRWSPNGTKIVFQSDRDNPFSGNYDIYAMNSDGSGVTRLTSDPNDDSMPSWSPDGSKILFQSLRNGSAYQVYSMNADGSNQINLTNTAANDIEPSWSPNGAKIAFASDRDHAGTSSVYVMNSNGTGQLRLTFSAATFNDRQPSWSRDGAKIAFVSTRDSVIDNWTETDDYEIPEDDGQTFPKSRVNVNKEIYTMNSDGSAQTRLTNELANDDSPSWSPDGAKIIFRSERERDCCDPSAQVWTMNADGSGQTDLSNNQMNDYSASWNSGSANQNPVANAGGGYSGVPTQSISFNGGNSSDPDGTITSYAWTFGDGGTGSGVNPTHVYAANGNYTVTLTVTDNLGAQGSSQTMASIAGASPGEMAASLLDPFNQTGNQLQARDCEWSLPLVSLPGRSGLDLGLTLSYSSMVWTKVGSYAYFDQNNGTPSPGFRLGFPTIGNVFLDAQANVNARMMVTSSGRRVNFLYAGHYGSYDQYKATDSSYAELLDYGGSIYLRATDGTNLQFTSSGGEWHCVLVRDRNGNMITAAYNGYGDITSVTDTLGRVINFHYDGNSNVDYIYQTWTVNGVAVEHRWATFGWETKSFAPSFSNVIPIGSYSNIPMLTQVGLPDGSYFRFEYNNFGQANAIRHYTGDTVQRAYATYDYDPNPTDCPRITASHVTATNWLSNVQTTFEDLGSGWHRMTMPDETQYTELYQLSGYQRGLTTQTEVWGKSNPTSSFIKQKWTTTNWTQDNPSLPYQLNPRVVETIIDDAGGNHRRTTIDYSPPSYAQWGLPYFVSEYANDGSTELRRTYTDYNLSQQYLDWHIIGLVSAVHVADLSNGWQWKAKTTYNYDEVAVDGQATTATQHDQSFNTSSQIVRGNLTSVGRWDVTDINQPNKMRTSQIRYNAGGSVLSMTDPNPTPVHQTSISYSDSFSDNTDHNTFAYPTTVTDADNYSSTVQYNFDFGGTTSTQNPLGAVQLMTFDDAIRLDRVTIQNTGAYTRFIYGNSNFVTLSTVNNVADESYTNTELDGLGRTIGVASSNPSGSDFKAVWSEYDVMGRVSHVSNPTEIDGAWNPTNGDVRYDTIQTYDWKGRPLRTIHPDTYYTELTYTGCGCAGGASVTSTDENGRGKRTTSDTLGRLIKLEELYWNGSVYSTANYEYNALDQIKAITHEGQTRSFDYDGYGRLHQRTTPEQGTTTYEYNVDNTLHMVTDARGVTATYGYNNNRHLVSSINYDESGDPTGQTAWTPPVSFGYDAAGNRTSMTDGLGTTTYHYDALSRMDWEDRQFGAIGTFRLSYAYNLANELTSITGPAQFGSVQVGYDYDTTGSLRNVTGSGYAGVSTYASDIRYRAFGAVKSMNFQDGHSLSTSYDNRMRPTSRNVSNVLGYNYSYLDHSDKVNYARNLYDSTLDRSYEYDQVGALIFAHSGAEARAAFGIDGTPWGNSDGPYSHWYDYDKFGNMTFRFGWGGEVQGGAPYGGDTTLNYSYSNGKNQLDGFGYDAAGNVTSGGGYANTYNAINQQTEAVGGSYLLNQNYDGNGLRWGKYENNSWTFYLRSTVLGGAVICELGPTGGWSRGYVYGASELLAVQQGGVYWNHEDALTKSRRVTDINGNIVSVSELDPWGADTNRSSNAAFQPQNFTTYIRDANGQQDAMARRYSPTGRFSQPDPYGGSYNFGDPQSMNRYAYTKNDPVNFRDPSGLDGDPDFGLGPPPPPMILVPPKGPLDVITTNTWGSSGSGVGYIFGDENFMIVTGSDETGGLSGGGVQNPTQQGGRWTDSEKKQPCDKQVTGNANVDEMTRFVFAEAGGNVTTDHVSNYEGAVGEIYAIVQVFVNRYNANQGQFGGHQFTGSGGVLSRASIADDNGGSNQYNRAAPDNLKNLSPDECRKYGVAQVASKQLWEYNQSHPGQNSKASALSNDYLWFLGGNPQTPGFRIGSTTFYTSYPGR